MDDTPDLAGIASLMGDRARATMLTGLMAGRPLTATELARSAGVTKQTASSHLSKLAEARLVSGDDVGRHRYFRLANHEVAFAIESLMGLARRVGAMHKGPGPVDPVMRKARVCYDHLAGDLGVFVYDGLVRLGWVRMNDRLVTLTAEGERFCERMGIDLEAVTPGKRPTCLACLDWSERRYHLAGALGAALLSRCFELGWARRHPAT